MLDQSKRQLRACKIGVISRKAAGVRSSGMRGCK